MAAIETNKWRVPATPRTLKDFLAQQREIDLLRFITCGSVDDGKSTLIGRLLHDTRQVLEDQLSAVANDSRSWGTTGEVPDLALLVDGLQAEREQGITIDVAYRYFRHRNASSSSPTARDTSSTRATWRPAPRPPTPR